MYEAVVTQGSGFLAFFVVRDPHMESEVGCERRRLWQEGIGLFEMIKGLRRAWKALGRTLANSSQGSS